MANLLKILYHTDRFLSYLSGSRRTEATICLCQRKASTGAKFNEIIFSMDRWLSNFTFTLLPNHTLHKFSQRFFKLSHQYIIDLNFKHCQFISQTLRYNYKFAVIRYCGDYT